MPTASQVLRCFQSPLLHLILSAKSREKHQAGVCPTARKEGISASCPPYTQGVLFVVQWTLCLPVPRRKSAPLWRKLVKYGPPTTGSRPIIHHIVCCSFVGPLLARVRTQFTPTLFTSVLSFVKTV